MGVQQVGPLRAGTTPRGARTLATATSPPLPVILRAMNLDSDNFIAETLAKDVGAAGAGRGTTTAGVQRTRRPPGAPGILGPRTRSSTAPGSRAATTLGRIVDGAA